MPARKTATSIQITKPYSFPELSSAPRMFTRHFANINFTLDQHQLSLLLFLIFMSEADNTIDYTVKILRQYRQAVKFAQERYEAKILKTSLPTGRRLFTELIERNLIMRNGDKYLINPNLTYSRLIPKGYLKEWDGTARGWKPFVK